VVSNPLMPGLDLHIPAGTVIRDMNGKVVTTLTITPVPLDGPPFPLPLGVQVPIYFTIQPGGSELWTTSGTWAWAQLYYPNPDHLSPGTRFDFWNYDPANSGWYVYGEGSVTPDGSQVIPDPGVGIWSFTGAMVGGPSMAPASPNPAPPTTPPPGTPQSEPQNPQGPPNLCPPGDPVDCSTGLFIESHADISLADVVPIVFTRTYRTADTRSRPFGIGATDNYEMFLVGSSNPWTYQDLILPDGARIYYPRISSGTGYTDAVYQNTSSPGFFYGSTIAWNGNGWNLKLRDGTIYSFPDSYLATNPAMAALIAITDRNGNKLTISRDSNGNITQITAPNGRRLQFQHDSSNRITQIQDDLERTVTYTYDSYSAAGRPACSSTGMLCAVTDADGGVASYTYDGSDRMLTMTDPRGTRSSPMASIP
jgi:YD repeat-containing protein